MVVVGAFVGGVVGSSRSTPITEVERLEVRDANGAVAVALSTRDGFGVMEFMGSSGEPLLRLGVRRAPEERGGSESQPSDEAFLEILGQDTDVSLPLAIAGGSQGASLHLSTPDGTSARLLAREGMASLFMESLEPGMAGRVGANVGLTATYALPREAQVRATTLHMESWEDAVDDDGTDVEGVIRAYTTSHGITGALMDQVGECEVALELDESGVRLTGLESLKKD